MNTIELDDVTKLYTTYNPSDLWVKPSTMSTITANVPYVNHITTLKADAEIGLYDNPEESEEYVRRELANKIANMLIEEDLIDIKTDDDILKRVRTVMATVKIVQE